MERPAEVRRVIVVILDGLRPDAVDAFDLVYLRRLARLGASTMSARTVSPSLTWPAMTSIMSGIHPEDHGVLADSVHIPKPKVKLAPLPELLQRAGFPSTAFMGEIPMLYKGIGSRIARGLGFAETRFSGDTAPEVLLAAKSTLRTQKRGLIFFHWADADRAGHEHGWMSREYGDAAKRLDATLALLTATTGVETDPHTLLIALADHGGGGIDADDHRGDHPLNVTIPLIMIGGGLRPRQLVGASLLDVPATVAWALGVAPHSTYVGRALTEAFDTTATAVA